MNGAVSDPKGAVGGEPARGHVQLVVRREGQVERTYVFDPSQWITVGRDEACTVALADLAVSRQHARFELGPDGLWVEDVSTNGTLVGEFALHRAKRRVPYGVSVCMGASELRFSRTSAPGDTLPGTHGVPLNAPTHGVPLNAPTHGVPLNAPTHGVPADEPLGGASVHAHARSAPTMGDLRNLPTPDGQEAAAAAMTSLEPGSDEAFCALRKHVHARLLEQLDMTAIDPGKTHDPALRPRVLAALRRIVSGLSEQLPKDLTEAGLVGQMADEALGLGPLEALLADRSVNEIMVLDAHTIYVERGGRVSRSPHRFTDDERVRAVIERIVTPLGRRVDESSPLVDARLSDGSRVNVVIRPVALRGSCITIRKFAAKPFSLSDLCAMGTLSEAMARFLVRSVQAKKNIVICGGTGSGKTTLLNVLSAAIPEGERIVTIEDAAELCLSQPHVVALEARPPNMEGKGEIPIRALVKNALRMRPDRIVVGECRGGEALDMLQAMNSGHDGSLTTTHANSPLEGLLRLETLSLMAGVGLPQAALREQLAASVHLVVQQTRLSDGQRRVTAIVELAGLDRMGRFQLRPIFEFVRSGTGADGAVQGGFQPTGYLPSYLHELLIKGLLAEGEPFL